MKKYLVIDCSIVLLLCIFAIQYWATSHNSLQANNRWNVSKEQIQMTVNGADSFNSRPHALHGNALHLDAWYGFHEVVTKKKYQFSQEQFDVRLSPNSYIYAEFHHTGDTFAAFRLSTYTALPSAFVLGKKGGEFIYIKPISVTLPNDTLFRVRITYDQKAKSVSLSINDTLISSAPLEEGMDGYIGFRGGVKPTTISRIRLYDEQNHIVFKENFTFYDLKVYLIICFSGILLLIGIEFIRFLSRRHTRSAVKAIVTFQILLLLGVFSFYLFQTILSDRYPNVQGWFSSFWAKKEIDWKTLEINARSKQLKEIPKTDAFRILFIGSSQTWGAGATNEHNTFVSLLERYLNSDEEILRALSDSPTYSKNGPRQIRAIECVNAGISAGKSIDLLTAFKNTWYTDLNPDLIVINLSNNDKGYPDTFKTNLTEFIRLVESKTNMLFILEANSQEFPNEIDENHVAMREVATQYHIPLIDLHAYLLSRSSDGILWWDKIHLTDFGHEITSKFLYTQLKNILITGSSTTP